MRLDFEKMGGLIPAVVQDAANGEVLMVGFMNEEALRETLPPGGHLLQPLAQQALAKGRDERPPPQAACRRCVDCDGDTLLVRVEAARPGVCHEGYRSCFYRELQADGSAKVIAERVFDPAPFMERGR